MRTTNNTANAPLSIHCSAAKFHSIIFGLQGCPSTLSLAERGSSTVDRISYLGLGCRSQKKSVEEINQRQGQCKDFKLPLFCSGYLHRLTFLNTSLVISYSASEDQAHCNHRGYHNGCDTGVEGDEVYGAASVGEEAGAVVCTEALASTVTGVEILKWSNSTIACAGTKFFR